MAEQTFIPVEKLKADIRLHVVDTVGHRVVTLSPEGRVLGKLEPTGIRPQFADRLQAFGQHLPETMFNIGRWS